jgi:hypothetical protein
MSSPAVDVTIDTPARFDPLQILVRLVLAIALGFLGVTAGWLAGALYLVLPAIAAVTISSRGSDLYHGEVAPALSRVLAWVIAFHAYMLMVVDRLQVAGSATVRVTVHAGGRAAVHTALLRLLTSLPAALLLAVLLVPAGLFAAIGIITILVARTQPEPLLRFQRAVICYAGQLAAYHASLVDAYPSFKMPETGARDMRSMAASS